jgi:hypothetical protein
MKLYPFRFDTTEDYIELTGVADLHYGSSVFLPRKAEKHRQYILDHNSWVIDLGDSTENATHSAPGASIFQSSCPPREQRAWVREYYRPMRDKVLAVVASNHGDRSERDVDWTPDEDLISFLDPCVHIRWEGVLAITVGDAAQGAIRGQQYLIFIRHMISNSSKVPQILGAMIAKSRTVQGCDVYWAGHCHQFISEPIPCELPDPRHGRMKRLDQWFLMSDAFIEHDESYAEQRNFSQPAEGQISLKLFKNERKIEVVRLVYR